MSYKGNWTPGALMWIGAEQQASKDQPMRVPPRHGTRLTGARNGLPDRPYVWRAAGRARELEIAAELEAMRDCIRGRLDVSYGPGAGAHAYRQCAGDCRYCAAEQPAEGELCSGGGQLSRCR